MNVQGDYRVSIWMIGSMDEFVSILLLLLESSSEVREYEAGPVS